MKRVLFAAAALAVLANGTLMAARSGDGSDEVAGGGRRVRFLIGTATGSVDLEDDA